MYNANRTTISFHVSQSKYGIMTYNIYEDKRKKKQHMMLKKYI